MKFRIPIEFSYNACLRNAFTCSFVLPCRVSPTHSTPKQNTQTELAGKVPSITGSQTLLKYFLYSPYQASSNMSNTSIVVDTKTLVPDSLVSPHFDLEELADQSDSPVSSMPTRVSYTFILGSSDMELQVHCAQILPIRKVGSGFAGSY